MVAGCSSAPRAVQPASARSRVPVPPPFRNSGQVEDGLREFKARCLAGRDPRGVFATVYLETTTAVRSWIREDRFASGSLLEKYLVTFANAYQRALAGDPSPGAVPAAWRRSLDPSRRGSVLEDLLLGVNAHVNHDLPFAIAEAGLDVRCALCRRDHDLFIGALREALPRARREIALRYRPDLVVPNAVLGWTLDRRIAGSVARARDHAWTGAVALETAPSQLERARVAAAIEQRAAAAARRIEACSSSPGRCLSILASAGESALPGVVPPRLDEGRDPAWRCPAHAGSARVTARRGSADRRPAGVSKSGLCEKSNLASLRG